jgi:trk system potassium uptake protein TrkH
MSFFVVQRVLGQLVCLFSITMLPPIVVASIFGDPTGQIFGLSFIVIAAGGVALWVPVRKHRQELRTRDGFLVVALFWIVLGVCGAVPLWLADNPDLSAADAVFESISGLTTTAASVLPGVETLPPSIQFYRHQLQWFGGLGIVVLAVAVLPMLGVGGMQLYRAELPGPIKDMKLTPRITQTAKALWYVYFGMTVVCALAYWLAGMGPFDAICHSFSTVAIGGYSTRDASLGAYDSVLIESVAVFFMFASAMNYALHFVAWRERKLHNYLADPEFKAYFWILLTLSAVTVAYLLLSGYYSDWSEALRRGIFMAVSIATTTGYATDAFALWPGGLPVLLLFASFIGGCAGSTAGGMKVVRWLLMYKQGSREFQRLVHPNAEIAVKLGGRVVHPRVVDAVWGFFAVYVVVFALLMLVMLSTGMDQASAFAAVAASLNNLGSGLGDVATNYSSVTAVGKWAAVCAMLLGRLEIFALLVLVTPAFWRG